MFNNFVFVLILLFTSTALNLAVNLKATTLAQLDTQASCQIKFYDDDLVFKDDLVLDCGETAITHTFDFDLAHDVYKVEVLGGAFCRAYVNFICDDGIDCGFKSTRTDKAFDIAKGFPLDTQNTKVKNTKTNTVENSIEKYIKGVSFKCTSRLISYRR